jgi:hypothetical protein
MLGGGVLLPAVVTGILLAGATWLSVRPKYELKARLFCRMPEAGTAIEFRQIIRELQAPPDSPASAWPFGELLSIASVRFTPETAGSALRISLRTAEPQRAERLAREWIDERIASMGTNHAADRIDAILAGLSSDDGASDDDAEKYRSAVAALSRLREPLRQHRRARAEKQALLETLRRKPPPRGRVTPEKRQQALAADVALQQDLRHLRARGEEVRREVLAGLSAATEAAGRLSPARQALARLIDDLQVRGLESHVADVPAKLRSFLERLEAQDRELRETLTGSSEGLRALSLDEPQDMLDILDRLDSTVRLWADFSEEELAAQAALVDGLSEGQVASVRRILVHNQLKRKLFTLETACRELSDRLSTLRRDRNFRLDALTGSVRGLWKRVELQRRRVEERLQAQADQEARAAAEAEMARLADEIRQIELAEDQLREEFLGTFDVMMSSVGAALHEETDRQRSLWAEELRTELVEALGDDLDGVELSGGDFVLDPHPLNTSERVRWCAALGGGGGLACLLLLAAVNAGRRALSGNRGPRNSAPIG